MDHDDTIRRADSQTGSARSKAQAFEKAQSEIDRRLLLVTQSESSGEAVQKFEISLQELQKLDIAAGYVELLQEVDKLCSQCTSQLGRSDEAALDSYGRLQRLVVGLQPLQDAAEGAAPHLLDHVSAQAQALRDAIQTSFSTELEQTLAKMSWPKPIDAVPMALQQEWKVRIDRLLKLQRGDLEKQSRGAQAVNNVEDLPVLLPLEVMARPLEQRFTYHFSGNKATNRLDKPEYFLTHTIELISTYADFLQDALQPILFVQFRSSDLAMTPAYIDATTALITALLPMLRRKLASFAAQVSSQPQLLSHLVHEVMSFDTTIQEQYSYAPVSPLVSWRGLAYYLLDTCGYFQQWLGVESDFALGRYQAIIDAPDAGELDYDSVGAEATKPMKAAIRVNDLLETITDRYRPLASFSQKIRFLIDIQINIFDQFNLRLRNSLDAFIASSSAIARTVPGVSNERQSEVQGTKGLERLCRVFGSAEYLERAMRDWSDDVFFLELYDELQMRLQSPERLNDALGSVQEIQQRTSSTVGEEPSNGEVSGALFDETAGIYLRLRVRSEGMIVDMLTYGLRESLRLYAAVTTWASLPSNSSGTATSTELEPAFSLIAAYFGFLNHAVGKLPLRRISRQTCHALQSYVWDQVLLRHSFSTAGATQLATDVSALCSQIDRYVGPGQGQTGLRKLLEGVTLLSLPVRSEIVRVRNGVPETEQDDDDVAAWEIPSEDVAETKLGLFEVDRLMFIDNESARQVLRDLGLEKLSVTDAREALKRRVEIRS